jgi:hypothetical protein
MFIEGLVLSDDDTLEIVLAHGRDDLIVLELGEHGLDLAIDAIERIEELLRMWRLRYLLRLTETGAIS